ncbi:MAG: 50S ribosomal protein L23 [Chitinophagales bacterium]|jgi:large subunit ribosomal protein L23
MAREILIQPLVTEKMSLLSEKLNKYGFLVDKGANKIQIKNAVEEVYGVTVLEVNTIIVPAKRKTRYTRKGIMEGRTNLYKKAIVTVGAEDTIDFFEAV